LTADTGNADLTQILTTTRDIEQPGDRIVAISTHFLDRPYLANTLVGGPDEAERLVVALNGFDCFTLLDVVEALRRSSVAEDFPLQLRRVRYRDGEVSYRGRRHFFSDWVAADNPVITDLTSEVGQGRAVKVMKQLNRKSDGTLWLPGITATSREIVYVPTSAITDQILRSLQAGDYVGIYSDLAGLDVSHTGVIVKTGMSVRLRHASSRTGIERVVDEGLLDYLRGKPGLVVYRVKP
jgi:hypothetical protein